MLHGDGRTACRRETVRAPRARLSRLPRVRARPVAQHARRPTARTCSSSGATSTSGRSRPTTATGAEISDFLAELGGTERGSGLARDDPPQGGLPALLLPPPAPRGHARDRPHRPLTAPRRGRKLPQVLTRGEVDKLLTQPKGTEPTDLRDRALLELMYACGLRASEAIGLDVADVDLDDGLLRARGKGSKERIVPVGQSALEAVSRYLERGPARARRAADREPGCS